MSGRRTRARWRTTGSTFCPDKPVAVDDSYTVEQNSRDNILRVLANDIPSSNGIANLRIRDPLSTAGSSGTAVIDRNGTPTDYTDDFIRYTPAPGATRARRVFLHGRGYGQRSDGHGHGLHHHQSSDRPCSDRGGRQLPGAASDRPHRTAGRPRGSVPVQRAEERSRRPDGSGDHPDQWPGHDGDRGYGHVAVGDVEQPDRADGAVHAAERFQRHGPIPLHHHRLEQRDLDRDGDGPSGNHSHRR